MNVKIVFDSVDIIDGIKDSFSVHVSMEEDVFSARVVNLEPSPEMLNGKADAIINTASGEIASFPDGADGVPMKSLVVSMQPIQSLNGYDHPWPAGGGKNLAKVTDGTFERNDVIFTWANDEIRLNGTCTGNTWIAPSVHQTITLPAGTYTMSVEITGATGSGRLVAYGVNSNYIGYLYVPNNGARQTKTFTIESELTANCDGYIFAGNVYNNAQIKFQIEKGSTATAWTPYSNICPITGRTGLSVYVSPTQDVADATTYAIDWTSEAGTVYGGTPDVVTGALSSEWANIASYNGETITEPWLSSMDEYAPGATPTTGAQVVYKLAPPITYQLTPQEVKTLKGQNHVWSNAGDVDLTYVADTKLYIDNKIAQAIAAALNA